MNNGRSHRSGMEEWKNGRMEEWKNGSNGLKGTSEDRENIGSAEERLVMIQWLEVWRVPWKRLGRGWKTSVARKDMGDLIGGSEEHGRVGPRPGSTGTSEQAWTNA